jgi:hypothetical protein
MWEMLMSVTAAAEGTPEPTVAGIITAIATVFTGLALVITAIAGLVRSLRVESKVDGVGRQVDTVQSTIETQRDKSAVYVDSLLQAIAALQAEVAAAREAAVRSDDHGRP